MDNKDNKMDVLIAIVVFLIIVILGIIMGYYLFKKV